MCQSHSAAACSSQAPSGAVMPLQAAFSGRQRTAPPIRPRQRAGSAQTHTPSGRPSTSSGAATIISSSCCTMCAENSAAPRPSSGDTSATTTNAQPPKKAAACRVAQRARLAPRLRRRSSPEPST
jgi:hypothetical protein